MSRRGRELAAEQGGESVVDRAQIIPKKCRVIVTPKERVAGS